MKRKETSLTDEEYNDLFNSVIYSSLSSEVEKELNQNNEQHNDSEKDNFKPQSQGTTQVLQHFKSAEIQKNDNAKKKKQPSFCIPLKDKTSCSNKIPQKKFVPPHMKAAIPNTNQNSSKSIKNIRPNTTKNTSKNPVKDKEGSIKNALSSDQVTREIGSNAKSDKITTSYIENERKSSTKSAKSLKDNSDSIKKSNAQSKQNNLQQKASTLKKETPVRKSTAITQDTGSESTSSSDQSTSGDESENSLGSPGDKEDRGKETVVSITLSQMSETCGHLSLSGSMPTQLSQPPQSYSPRRRLLWLRARRDVGVWVQCCRAACCKWRYLAHIKDPILVPEYWVCDMSDDSRYNSCDKPEKGPTLSEQIDLIDNKYTAGSLVWARVTGYPWWPAIVDDDPDFEAYYWLNRFSDIPTHYHVVFFDKEDVTRAWVTPDKMKTFSDTETCQSRSIHQKGTKFFSRIEFAKKQALKAHDMELKDRLKEFGFLTRYKGPICDLSVKRLASKNSHGSNGQQKKRKLCHKNKHEIVTKRKSTLTKTETEKKKKKKVNENFLQDEKCETHSSGAENEMNMEEAVSNNTVSSQDIMNEQNTQRNTNSECTNGKLFEQLPDQDIDPFKESETEIENMNSSTITKNVSYTFIDSNDSFSHVATIGTFSSLNKPKNQLNNELRGMRSHYLNVERKEADTSSNITDITSFFIPSKPIFGNINEVNTSNSDKEVSSQSELNLQKYSDSHDAVVPEISAPDDNDGYTSDPFEEED